MDDPALRTPPLRTITRDNLRDGSLLAAVRATPGLTLRSDAELATSLAASLAARPSRAPVWVFGYGSLMWNPAFHYAERRRAMLEGWQRRFCLWLRIGRGTLEHPGLMLALDRGGHAEGVAFRLKEEGLAEELLLIWRREMVVVGYLAIWVTLQTEDGPVAALTFVADHAQEAYAADMNDEDAAARIAEARGPVGSCAEYLRETVGQLDGMGVRDENMERLRRLVARYTPEAGQPD